MTKTFEKIKFQDACEVFVDGDWIESKDQSSDGIRLIQTGNIGFGYFKDKNDKGRYISEDTFNKLKCTEILPGDLLISRLPDPVGKSCLIPDLNIKMITGVDCTVVRPKKILLPEFLCYYQMSDEYLNDVNSKVSGSTRSRISRKNLGTVEIPLPPLPEQKRIVSILDKAFAAIDKAKANYEQNLKNAKELFESYLQGVFEKKGKGWEKKTLGNLCEIKGRIGYRGYTVKDLVEKGNGAITLSPSNIVNNKFVLDRCTYISYFKYEESPEIKVYNGDILFVKTGSTYGKVALVEHLEEKATINPQFVVFKELRCNNKFLYYCLITKKFKLLVEGIIGGAATPTLSQANLAQLAIDIPSEEEQIIISKQLDLLVSETKNLESIYLKKIQDLEELKKSLLQKAFSGELTEKEIAV